MQQSWSIIIFCYNEQGNVGNVIAKTKKTLQKLTDTWELIIVDDGSTDGSIEEIIPYIDENVKVIKHEVNKGIGEALLSGYNNVQYENVCAIPADGEFDPEELLPYSIIPENTIVSFYRVVKTSYSSYRDLLSIINKKLNQWFLNLDLKDVNWVKIYKYNNLKSTETLITSSLVESQICSRLIKSGVKIKQVPSNYYTRVEGSSKGASKKIVWQAARDTLKLFLNK